MLAIKLAEKIPDLRNAKEHYQLFIKKKKTISVNNQKSKIITQQQKLLKTQILLI